MNIILYEIIIQGGYKRGYGNVTCTLGARPSLFGTEVVTCIILSASGAVTFMSSLGRFGGFGGSRLAVLAVPLWQL